MRFAFNLVARPPDLEAELRRAAELGDWSAGAGLCAEAEGAIAGLHGGRSVRLTASCTAALELAALQLDLRAGDNVIVPSFAYPTCASAFTRAGAEVRFADIDLRSGCVCPDSVARLIDAKTRAVLAIHYAGAAWRLAELAALCAAAEVELIEDCAHAFAATLEGRPLGAFGRFAALSFHATKNLACGEGGALIFDADDLERVDQTFWSGTNRSDFSAGKTPAYTWVREGGSFGLSAFQAAALKAQLGAFEAFQERRLMAWRRYSHLFGEELAGSDIVVAQARGADRHGAHIFYLLLPDAPSREEVRLRLLDDGVDARAHYQALHLSPHGRRIASPAREGRRSAAFAERLLRLPLHAYLSARDIDEIVERTLAVVGRTVARAA